MSGKLESSADRPQSKTPAPAKPAPESDVKRSETNNLQATSAQTGTAAQRLLAQDDSRHVFHYQAVAGGLLYRWRRYGWFTLRYLPQTEVHTYAFSLAAHSILFRAPLRLGC